MKKNSFTLIELIGVLLLLGTISLIIVPNVLKSINDANVLASNEQIAAIKEASLNYSVKNDLGYYNNIEKTLSFDDLINGGFLTEKDIKAKDGNRLPGCVIYKWLDNSNQYNFRYDEECDPVIPTVEITFNVLNDAINSDGWANSEFYVKVNVTNSNGYKWCSTTSDTCTPAALVTGDNNSVLISSNSVTNKICVQAKNSNDEEGEIICSDNYKLDSNLPNIASNSEGYVVVTPGTSINVINYFNYSPSGLSNIASTSCRNITSDQNITETSSLAIGEYNIECTATTESGSSNSADITLSISNCYGFNSNGGIIYLYYCYIGNTGGYREISNLTIPYSIDNNIVTSISSGTFNSRGLTNIKMPGRLTEIGANAFESNQLTNVVIPNSVTTIGRQAFNKNQLVSLTLSENLTSIENFTFSYNQLTNITIPDSVTSIGEYAFYQNKLTNVIIPENVKTIGYQAFNNNQLTSVTISNGVTTIGGWAFGNNQITNVTIPNSVTSIGDYAFSSNQITGGVTIPNGVTIIGVSVFKSNQLTSVTIQGNVTSIGSSAFAYNQLTNITIPNSVTTIGAFSFELNKLTSITIPNNVTTIGNYAFLGNQLTSVTIPNSVTNIGTNAFQQNKLITVTLGTGLISIGSSAFYKGNTSDTNSSLTTIYNNSGQSYDWTGITGSSTAGQSFVTCTITHQYGNITVTTN